MFFGASSLFRNHFGFVTFSCLTKERALRTAVNLLTLIYLSSLTTVTATLVSKANAQGDQEDLQDAVSQALVVGFCVSLVGTALMLRYPEKVLSSVLKGKCVIHAFIYS